MPLPPSPSVIVSGICTGLFNFSAELGIWKRLFSIILLIYWIIIYSYRPPVLQKRHTPLWRCCQNAAEVRIDTKQGHNPKQCCTIYPSESQGLPLNDFLPYETFTCFGSQQGQDCFILQFDESAWSPLKKSLPRAVSSSKDFRPREINVYGTQRSWRAFSTLLPWWLQPCLLLHQVTAQP